MFLRNLSPHHRLVGSGFWNASVNTLRLLVVVKVGMITANRKSSHDSTTVLLQALPAAAVKGTGGHIGAAALKAVASLCLAVPPFRSMMSTTLLVVPGQH